MLHQLLHEFETAAGPLNLNELAHNLKVERSALEGMIQFWVRKGRISDSQIAADAAPPQCSGLSCASACPGAERCPFVVNLPRRFALNDGNNATPKV